MRNNMKSKIIIFLGLLIISSCTFHRGQFANINTQQSEDETWVDIAISRARTVHFLGIGGNRKTVLFADLKNEILFTYKDSLFHSLRNFTLTEKRIYFGSFIKTIYYMTADVYKHSKPRKPYSLEMISMIDTSRHNSAMHQIILPSGIITDGVYAFHTNEKVDFYKYYDETTGYFQISTGKIISLRNRRALIATYTYSGIVKLQFVNYKNIFKTQPNSINMKAFSYSIGDSIKYPVFSSETNYKLINATLLNTNHKYLLLKNESGKSVRLSISSYQKFLKLTQSSEGGKL